MSAPDGVHCLISSQRVHLLKQPNSFEQHKKTGGANNLVRAQQHFRKVSQLPAYSHSCYHLRFRRLWKDHHAFYDRCLSQYLFYLWHGNFLLPLRLAGARAKGIQYFIFIYNTINYFTYGPALDANRQYCCFP